MKKVSVIINTYNRADLLLRTLESFKYIDYPLFEIIVINGPSTDHTEEVLDKFRELIKIGHCAEANLSKSRNIGISYSSGDIVAFIDDDAIPEPEWLTQIVEAFDSCEVGAVGGKVFDHTGYKYQYQYANADRLGHGKWQMEEPSPNYCFPRAYEFPYLQGTNTAFRRDVLVEIGGFDEEFIYYLDETDVCLRIIDNGYFIKQLANAYVHHKYAPSHIRTKSAAVYRYPVLKSKVYFSNRHGYLYHTQDFIDSDNMRFIQNHRSDIESCISSGKLPEEALVSFEEHAILAMKQGREESRQKPKLISSRLLERNDCAFKKFYSIHADDEKRLTIVLLCEDYPPNLLGGIARFTQDKATALAQLGHKVHVIARGDEHSTVDFENGVWVHRIVVQPNVKPCEIEHLNILQSHWDQSKSFLDEIDRISTHRSIDIVEAPIWNVVGIAPLLSGRYRVITSLMTTLKLSLSSRPDLTANKELMASFVNPLIEMERYMILNSDSLLAISKGILNEVQKAYSLEIDENRLFVSHLGMPDWREKSDMQEVSNDNEINILFVGRLEKRKGIDLLLSIIPDIVAAYPNVSFDIVGDDSIPVDSDFTYRTKFENEFGILLNEKIKFHGKVDEIALRKHYSKCDIFVAPSRFESFGLIYVEAMMYGKPVIGCDVGGIPEVVEHNVNGILISPGNANELYEALSLLITNPSLRRKLGKEGRMRYENLFSDVQMAKSSVNMYKKIVAINMRDA
ncbi:glycosyltransferase [Citrobacter sp. Igbk 14]|uniref:glycosyltransferase n=1 Tax=Citrobacter sp. Igbk 14 TaxID=2963960 RepID=UPI002304A616|nr:glycosyltransferase [Citrobacter sp. Igbk 14]MDA8514728.1 glycosyltransferase [Citrobacter sp. Igbk 14]